MVRPAPLQFADASPIFEPPPEIFSGKPECDAKVHYFRTLAARVFFFFWLTPDIIWRPCVPPL